MKILAIETATEACSVALLEQDHCDEIFEVIPRRHTERVLPMVDGLLQKNGVSLSQIDAIAYSCGPGSFTGVRVGTSVAQGLAFSCDIPLIPISSLAALAQFAYRKDKKVNVISTIDARMNELYWGCYELESGLMKRVSEEKVSPVIEIEKTGEWHCLGSGWDVFQIELNQSAKVNITSFSNQSSPHAQDVAVLAADLYLTKNFIKAEDAHPSYIRDEVTWKKLKDQ